MHQLNLGHIFVICPSCVMKIISSDDPIHTYNTYIYNPARGKSGCPSRFAAVKFNGVHRLRFLVLTGGTLCVS
jgi:hypothetical protein